MSTTETTLEVAQGRFTLQRRPRRRKELLRAWDAADEYLLREVAKQRPARADRRILVVNDSFGALTVALAPWASQAWSDSFLSQLATRDNLLANGIDPGTVTLLHSMQQPTGPLDLILIKVPKTLALLEDQLIKLRPLLTADTKVLVAGMVKALPRSVWTLLEKLLGPTDTDLAWKKAKLIRVTPDPGLTVPDNPYPVQYRLEGTDWFISNHANVFSRDSLDIGTRFFLQHLPVLPQAQDIIDLGCGNGVLGLQAAARHPTAMVHFVDESFMAVASARENFNRAFGAAREAAFCVGDGLEDFSAASADLVLCNPPFHQQQTVGDQIAQRMFKQAQEVLRPGGELWVIGNRHLGYHSALKRLFGKAELIASNAKFVILRVQRGPR
ncbi:methyltransferase [Congregibacter variabilis]|uniref:Ribosomal RNA large subunit methyltransferase G n=1 Tax=Congregibacter variabilis TaxID=3081200 RepID=A0ABZ0I085_9GAMM|nr:methyltransferase [Congregibacter sp. IMCC43200]